MHVHVTSRIAYGFENNPLVSDEKSYSLADLVAFVVAEERGNAEGLFTPTVATPLTGEAVPVACMLQNKMVDMMTGKRRGKKTNARHAWWGTKISHSMIPNPPKPSHRFWVRVEMKWATGWKEKCRHNTYLMSCPLSKLPRLILMVSGHGLRDISIFIWHELVKLITIHQ